MIEEQEELSEFALLPGDRVRARVDLRSIFETDREPPAEGYEALVLAISYDEKRGRRATILVKGPAFSAQFEVPVDCLEVVEAKR